MSSATILGVSAVAAASAAGVAGVAGVACVACVACVAEGLTQPPTQAATKRLDRAFEFAKLKLDEQGQPIGDDGANDGGADAKADGGRGWFLPVPTTRLEPIDDADAGKVARLRADGGPMGNLMRIESLSGRSRRFVVTARVRVENGSPADGAGFPRDRVQLWARLDLPGDERGDRSVLDNMGDRPITAAQWRDYTIMVQTPEDGPAPRSLALGLLVFGKASAVVQRVRVRELGDEAWHAAPAPVSEPGAVNIVAAVRLAGLVRHFHPSDGAIATDWTLGTIALIEAAEPAADNAALARALQDRLGAVAPTVQVWAGNEGDGPAPGGKPDGATHATVWRHIGMASTGAGERRGGTMPYSSRVARAAIAAWPEGDAGPALGETATRQLAPGVWCRVPITVWATADRTLPEGKAAGAGALVPARPEGWAPAAADRGTRLANVATLWNIAQHSYPYFDRLPPHTEAETEAAATARGQAAWDAALLKAIRQSATDRSAIEHLRTLRELIAVLADGHGFVNGPGESGLTLPLRWTWADDGRGGHELVVTAAAEGTSIKPGDVVTQIGGTPVTAAYTHAAESISAATEGFRRWRALDELASVRTMAPVKVHVRRGAEGQAGNAAAWEFDASLTPVMSNQRPDEPARPTDGGEVAPGIVYFNLDGATMAKWNVALPAMRAARGVVFDLRGYPNDAAMAFLRLATPKPLQSAKWRVPQITRPDRDRLTYVEAGRWNLPPMNPRLPEHLAVITDGRAVSYAESVLGIVEAEKLAMIVGEPTAGTNGNIVSHRLGAGYSIVFTGMRVTKHDESPLHGVGVLPTHPARPTAAGIAAGRDEQLEIAVRAVQERIKAVGESSSPGGEKTPASKP